MALQVSIVGASGYTGGELLRLLIPHPGVEIRQVTSRRHARQFVRAVHPHLRGFSDLRFIEPEELEPCDLLFLCLPHGRAAEKINDYARLAGRIIDLSADFRLRSAADYRTWYGREHPSPAWLPRFVYGLPEFNRDALSEAAYVSGVGCNATAANLALAPLARTGLLRQAVVEVKVGSSEGGNQASEATHHPVRSGAMRSFAPTGHRHQAEILQALGTFDLHFSATAVEMVRGVLCTAHLFLAEPLDEKEIWKCFRELYRDEPFVRLVKERRGLYRYPEPKLLAGTNFCDVGFELDERTGRVVVISALDNLVKGAAGSAVQCLNLMLGLPETTGLMFMGLHPV